MSILRIILLAAIAIPPAVMVWAHLPPLPLPAGARVDRVLVKKSSRELFLLHEDRVLRRYKVSLGGDPVGHKQRQGDRRTPEGVYTLDYRKPDSAFHRALHVSYPNAEDRENARRAGRDPGGLIMIHGVPDRASFRLLGRFHRLYDWTDGCVAVTNREIEQIWQAVDDGTPIEIRP